jgi:3-hydroxyethyl bacteriochlorophyllide a dehydrogenase
VVVDVEYSWISNGTESSFLRGERIAGDTPRKPEDPWPFPHVAGYQKTGVVRSAGAKVSHVAAGDRVFASVSRVRNMFYPFAGHISPAVTPADQVWRLPAGTTGLPYCGAVLTQVGYNCGTRPPAGPGARAVVIGDGLVGQWSAQTLLDRGAKVSVLGRHDERLRCLPDGAEGVNLRTVELADWLTDEPPVHVVIDTVGDLASIKFLLPLMTRDSHIVSAGFYGTRGLIDIQELRDKEITLHCPAGWTRPRMDRTIEAIAQGRLSTEPLITHRLAARDAAKAWNLIRDRSRASLGVILDWR